MWVSNTSRVCSVSVCSDEGIEGETRSTHEY